MQSLGITVFLLYGLTAVSYAAFFMSQKRSWSFGATLVLSLTAFLHFIYIMLLTEALGRVPIVSVFEVLTSGALLFAFVYLVLESIIKDKSMGVVIAPVLFVFQMIALTGIDLAPKSLPSPLTILSYKIHVVCNLLAYSGFAIAFIASAMHLLLAREIHQKRLGFFFSRIPPLELLDRLNASAATLGFAFATLGMVLGFLMALQYWGTPVPFDPKFISFFLTWCIYFFHIISRVKFGWCGERAAWLSILGFMWVLVSLFIVSVYLTKLHLYI